MSRYEEILSQEEIDSLLSALLDEEHDRKVNLELLCLNNQIMDILRKAYAKGYEDAVKYLYELLDKPWEEL